MIEPTVGRVVWYWESPDQKQPMKADIAFVNSDGTINIGGLNEFGYHFARQNIELWQGEGNKPPVRYCEWPVISKAQNKPISANSITYETTAPERDKQAPVTHTFKD